MSRPLQKKQHSFVIHKLFGLTILCPTLGYINNYGDLTLTTQKKNYADVDKCLEKSASKYSHPKSTQIKSSLPSMLMVD